MNLTIILLSILFFIKFLISFLMIIIVENINDKEKKIHIFLTTIGIFFMVTIIFFIFKRFKIATIITEILYVFLWRFFNKKGEVEAERELLIKKHFGESFLKEINLFIKNSKSLLEVEDFKRKLLKPLCKNLEIYNSLSFDDIKEDYKKTILEKKADEILKFLREKQEEKLNKKRLIDEEILRRTKEEL